MGTFAPAYPPALMTREAAAHYTGRSTRDLDDLRTKGHLTAVAGSPDPKDRRIFYRKEDLDEFVAGLPEKHSEKAEEV